MFRIACSESVRVSGLVVVTLAALAFGGCGGSTGFGVESELVPYTPEQIEARDAAREARYLLRVGDRFKVAFKFEPDLDQDGILIMPDGYVSMNGLPVPVRAAGLAIEQLDATLEAAYGKDYRNPDLSVIVYDIANPEVYVLGWVKNPGLYKIPSNGTGIVQAVAMAGGFLEDGKMSQTVLLRATDEGFLARTYDLSQLQNIGIADLSYLDLQPYDIIYVPRSALGSFAYVTDRVFGSLLDVTRFFWDIYALGNLDKINTIIR